MNSWITLGEGDDVVFPDCSVNNLNIYGEGGTDTLVLMARNFAEFQQRCEGLLRNTAKLQYRRPCPPLAQVVCSDKEAFSMSSSRMKGHCH